MNTTPFAAVTSRRQRGLSLVESLIVLAVTTVSLGAALPNFKEAMQRRHFDGVVAQLETDLQQARSLAVAHNQNLRVSFLDDAAGSCYLIHEGPANACRCDEAGRAVCGGDHRVLHSSRVGGTSALRLRSNVTSMVFDATRGTVTPTGTVRVEGPDGRAVHVVVNVLGRARNCSPGATVPGYKTC